MSSDKNTSKILSIVALGFLGLCLLAGAYSMVTKKEGEKATCNKVCATFVFVAVVLIAVGQLVTEEGFSEKMSQPLTPPNVCGPNTTGGNGGSCFGFKCRGGNGGNCYGDECIAGDGGNCYGDKCTPGNGGNRYSLMRNPNCITPYTENDFALWQCCKGHWPCEYYKNK